MNIFITGASGFLGSAVLARMAHLDLYENIYILMRANKKKTADERAVELINKTFSPEEAPTVLKKIRVVEGDLTSPHLGLSVRDRWNLLDKIHQILHIGASTDFGAPLHISRRYNVEGTRMVLDLAEACSRQGVLRRLDYISTCFVSGDKRGVVTEDSLERNQTFANNYERSKYEAEILVREYMPRIDICVHRPAIVVGDSQSGYTPHFKVLYWPLKLLSRNLLPFVPCKPSAKMDVVPVDYVASAINTIMTDENTVGHTWHISAGIGNEANIKDILQQAEIHAGIKMVPLLPFFLFTILSKTPLRKLLSDEFWAAADLASPYDSYLRGTGVRIDASKTHAYLESKGVTLPLWNDYKHTVLAFIKSSRWGKKLEAPDYSYFEASRKQYTKSLDLGVKNG